MSHHVPSAMQKLVTPDCRWRCTVFMAWLIRASFRSEHNQAGRRMSSFTFTSLLEALPARRRRLSFEWRPLWCSKACCNSVAVGCRLGKSACRPSASRRLPEVPCTTMIAFSRACHGNQTFVINGQLSFQLAALALCDLPVLDMQVAGLGWFVTWEVVEPMVSMRQPKR